MRWSISAHHKQRRCERQAFFANALASHSAADAWRNEIYVLKQLKHQAAWQGSVIHRVLETTVAHNLRLGRVQIDVDSLVHQAKTLAHKQFEFSRKGAYRGSSKSSAGEEYAALYLHEYGGDWGNDPVEKLANVSRVCFETLSRQSDLLTQLARAKEIQSERSFVTSISGVSVTATPDLLAAFGGSANCTVLDWKVVGSKTSSHVSQLQVYGLVMLKLAQFGISRSDQLRLLEVNLLQDQTRDFAFDERVAVETEDFIFRSGRELESLLKPAVSDSLQDQLLDSSLAKSSGSCALCNFRQPCQSARPHEEVQEAIQGVLL
jgi:hypothetical protein